MTPADSSLEVLRYSELPQSELAAVLDSYGLTIQIVADKKAIPGSYWGDSEAGLVERQVYARNDTPIHSIMHESCHFICMTEQRRATLHTDAGGDFCEENAVCYLQILLAGKLRGMGPDRMLADMDRWGYSFRLGSARQWFVCDADEPRAQLLEWGVLNTDGQPSGQLRHGPWS